VGPVAGGPEPAPTTEVNAAKVREGGLWASSNKGAVLSTAGEGATLGSEGGAMGGAVTTAQGEEEGAGRTGSHQSWS
jgi:hypothetical protein